MLAYMSKHIQKSTQMYVCMYTQIHIYYTCVHLNMRQEMACGCNQLRMRGDKILGHVPRKIPKVAHVGFLQALQEVLDRTPWTGQQCGGYENRPVAIGHWTLCLFMVVHPRWQSVFLFFFLLLYFLHFLRLSSFCRAHFSLLPSWVFFFSPSLINVKLQCHLCLFCSILCLPQKESRNHQLDTPAPQNQIIDPLTQAVVKSTVNIYVKKYIVAVKDPLPLTLCKILSLL